MEPLCISSHYKRLLQIYDLMGWTLLTALVIFVIYGKLPRHLLCLPPPSGCFFNLRRLKIVGTALSVPTIFWIKNVPVLQWLLFVSL